MSDTWTDPNDPAGTTPAPGAQSGPQADPNVQAPTEPLGEPSPAAVEPAPTPSEPLSATPSTTPASTIGVPSAVAQEPETPADAQTVATHAIGPGSAGDQVAALAQKVEAAGEKTYLSNPTAQNPAHVFTDELMQAIRRVLHAHPAIVDVTDEAERQRLNRWINGLEVVTAEVHKLIGEVADAKTAETTSRAAGSS